jgi:hypothetical protein
MSDVNYVPWFIAEYECILLVCNSPKFQTLPQISKVFTFVNTRTSLESLDVFPNLTISNSPRNRRKFQVSMADYPYFKPNTISYVFNSYLLKYTFFGEVPKCPNSLCKILYFKFSFKNMNISSPGFTVALYSVLKFKRHFIIPV